MGDYYCENKVSSSSAAELFDEMLECEDRENSPSKGVNGRFLYRKVKYELGYYHSLPAFMRDNEYIHCYYRSGWPMKQVLLSVFTIHKETLNVWTRLIGFFLFLFLTTYTATGIPQVVDLNSLQHFPAELVKWIPSLPDTTALHKMQENVRTSIPYLVNLHGLSGVKVIDFLSSCLPEHFLSRLSQDAVGQMDKDGMTDMVASLIPGPITQWPFFAFLGGAVFCLLASNTCHLL